MANRRDREISLFTDYQSPCTAPSQIRLLSKSAFAPRDDTATTRRPMKIVLAYSGGLDTSVLVAWLKETYRAEIIAFTADVVQEEALDGLEAKALRTGASKIFIDDLTEEF